MLRVSMSTGPFPPFNVEAEKIKDLKEVVWSAIGAGGASQYSVNDHSDIDDDYQLDFAGVKDYLDLVDIVTFWTWERKNLGRLDENIENCIRKTPGKRHFAGCYLWNYGERKPLAIEQMKFQLERYLHWIKQGSIEGIIFCSNATVPDVGLDTAEYTRKWILDSGNEKMEQLYKPITAKYD